MPNDQADKIPKEVKIKETAQDDWVKVEKVFEDNTSKPASLPATAFVVTDRALAFQVGNIFRGKPWQLEQFADAPPGQSTKKPELDRNPYNFVAFVGDHPWKQTPPHANHAQWHPERLHGEITFTLESRSPVFTPTGNPDIEAGDDVHRSNLELHFFRMKRSDEDFNRYAIPGSSIKGVLRSMVEAVANDRLGIFSSEHSSPIQYRRWDPRVRKAGKVPATSSVADLCRPFAEEPQSLNQPLGLADLMFGFAAPHSANSHPFRGKIRIETAWGPRAASENDEKAWGEQPSDLPDKDGKGIKVRLAPLTSPTTHAKSQPLYLQPRRDGSCQTYSDRPIPSLRGRKFYWRQRSKEAIWKYHRFDKAAHANVESQCPPHMCCLQEVNFTCRLEFENLSPEELGCLLFILRGDENRTDHTLAFGKGKPRGLGACKVTDLKVTTEDPRARYAAVVAAGHRQTADAGLQVKWIRAFEGWCERMHGGDVRFHELEHIRDFLNLHAWPLAESVRYYPPNFTQYNPAMQRGDKPGKAVSAMNLAHKIPVEPITTTESTDESVPPQKPRHVEPD